MNLVGWKGILKDCLGGATILVRLTLLIPTNVLELPSCECKHLPKERAVDGTNLAFGWDKPLFSLRTSSTTRILILVSVTPKAVLTLASPSTSQLSCVPGELVAKFPLYVESRSSVSRL